MKEGQLIVSAIAAMDRNGLIGGGMKMPWHLPADLRRFRKETMGKPVVMGRRTFESLRGPLDGRLNIILTNHPSFHAEGCLVARSIEDALGIAKEQSANTEVTIIGGGVVFEETISLWNRLLLTVIDGEFQGDTYFPVSQVIAVGWGLVSQQFFPADAKNVHSHRFLRLERLKTDSPPTEPFDLGAWLKDLLGPIASPNLTRC